MSCLMKRNISRQTVSQTLLLSSLQQLPTHTLKDAYTTRQLHRQRRSGPCDVVPNVQQMHLQFINALQLQLMHSLPDVTPYLVSNRIVVGAILWPQIRRNESGC